MACTTILVGKNASYDGSTMVARNDDSGSGHFTAKKFVVVQPEEHPAVYRSVISHVEVPLPGHALRMTAMPNAVEGEGIFHVERYEEGVLSATRALLNTYDEKQAQEADPARRAALRTEANEAIARELKARAADTLNKVLFELSCNMKNAFSRSDA